jgi:hypothetical protein
MEQFCWKGVTGTMATLICDITHLLGRHDSGSRAREPQKRHCFTTDVVATGKNFSLTYP